MSERGQIEPIYDALLVKEHIGRRGILKVGGTVFFSGALGALEALLTGCGGTSGTTSNTGTSSSTSSTSTTSGSGSTSTGSGSTGGTTSSSSCLESTNVTRGPYFVDNKSDPNISGDVVDTTIAERSDIRADTKGSAGTQGGLPLTLNITVGSFSSTACSAIAGAQVFIWHCNAQGSYSDVSAASNGASTANSNYLRGFQYTNSAGQVTFTTIYPGWYSGRTVHIHLKIRIFDSSGNVTTEATTQLFFDDSTTDAVYAANSSYSRTGARNVRNAADSIYNSEDPALLVSLSGSSTSGYTGTISIGINVGTIYGG